MASAEIILARVDDGEDPELDKLVNKRADELGITRLEALITLLPSEESDMDEPVGRFTRDQFVSDEAFEAAVRCQRQRHPELYPSRESDMETYEGQLTINATVNEDEESTARHILAERLRDIAAALEMGFKLEGRIMHPNGHAIGSFALMQTNLPED
jgi:hypothetical protein